MKISKSEQSDFQIIPNNSIRIIQSKFGFLILQSNSPIRSYKLEIMSFSRRSTFYPLYWRVVNCCSDGHFESIFECIRIFPSCWDTDLEARHLQQSKSKKKKDSNFTGEQFAIFLTHCTFFRAPINGAIF